MLSVGPWNRLGLTIRWLKQEYQLPFPSDSQPPVHMPISYGLVELMKETNDEGCSTNGSLPVDSTEKAPSVCHMCNKVCPACVDNE